mmetsp:Transcript_2601/g.5285  ORF Transcript_2601/g.5285 Transcript_2601/m.5285 type:complete len:264 (+) Transcript_2601:667-1458(+)
MRISVRDQGHCIALLPRTPCASNAVHVILGLRWQVVVHNQCDTFDVKTTRGDVSGNEQLDLSTFQVIESLLPLTLALVAMNGSTGDPIALQVASDLVAHSLGTTEDNSLRGGIRAVGNVGLLQDLTQNLILVVAGALLDDLGDVLVALKFVAVANLHLEGVSQELRGQSADGGRPSGGEEHRVPLPWHLVQNLPDLWLKTHVKHAVCLIKDELDNTLEAQLAPFKKVVDAAGGAGDAMNTGPDLRQLFILRCASVAACSPEAA